MEEEKISCNIKVKDIIELAKEIEVNFEEVSKLYSPEYEKEFKTKIKPKYEELQKKFGELQDKFSLCSKALEILTKRGLGVSDIDEKKFKEEISNTKKICD